MEEAEARREALRAELHEYGALSAEPDRAACCAQLECAAHDRELDDFMRKAGGLKHELLALAQVRKRGGGAGVRSPGVGVARGVFTQSLPYFPCMITNRPLITCPLGQLNGGERG